MKIFLIDDEPVNNVISSKILTKIDSSLNIIKFTNPKLAYEAMGLEKPDLILLDLNMPPMSGWEFLEKMKKENISFQVVILTSSVSRSDNQKSHNFLNVLGYAEKPLNQDVIRGYLNQVAEAIAVQ